MRKEFEKLDGPRNGALHALCRGGIFGQDCIPDMLQIGFGRGREPDLHFQGR